MLSRRVVQMLVTLAAAVTVSVAGMANGLSALEVVEKARDMWRGETFHAVVAIEITRGERTDSQVVEVWAEGEDHALVRILKPEEDAGSGYLLVGDEENGQLWYYDHNADEAISLPRVALHEGFLGSGLDLDELLRGTVAEHYEVAYAEEQPDEGYAVDLVPLPRAAVVYGKLVLTISEAFVLTGIDYYDQRDNVVKTARAEELMEVDDRVVPRVWVVEEAVGDRTSATYKELSLDEPLPEDIFTLERLKRP